MNYDKVFIFAFFNSSSTKIKIQVSAPHGHLGLRVNQFEFGDNMPRSDWEIHAIDGMIGFWEFTDEFLAFKGPKVFYCCEPSFYFNGFRAFKQLLRARLASLRQDEFAWHHNTDKVMRVVHHTGNWIFDASLEQLENRDLSLWLGPWGIQSQEMRVVAHGV